MKYLILFRANQWIKNLFVFAPLVFSFQLFNLGALGPSLLAFISFSLSASSVYIFNDIKDVEIDRLHPRKKHRPIASGEVNVGSAYRMAIVLVSSSILLGVFLGVKNLIVLACYLLMNLAYTLKLKHIAVLDIFCIATGFVIRLFMGSYASSIPLSQWIIIMTFLLAVFMALAKRRDDVIIFLNGGEVRKSIEGYNLKFIEYSMAMSAAVVLVAYLMYCMSPEVMAQIGSSYVYITFPFVLFGLMRYLQITLVLEDSGAPSEIILKDRFMQLALIGWFVTFLLLKYT